MLEVLKVAYNRHAKLRFCVWLSIIILVAMFIVLGGFPPRTWILCIQALLRLPTNWQVQGTAILMALLVLVLASLIWGLAWGGLIWCIFILLRYHIRHRQAYNFDTFEQIWEPGLLQEASTFSSATQSAYFPESFSLETQTSLPTQTSHIRIPQRIRNNHARNSTNIATPLTAVSEQGVSLPYEVVALQEIPTRPTKPSPSEEASDRISFSSPLEVGVGWNSGITRVDKPNEDSIVALQGTCTYHEQLMPFALLVVADGMGGHDNGREASRLAMQSMMHTVLQNIVMGRELSDEFLIDMLIGGVEWANRAILQYARQLNGNMGTTLTAALVVGHKAYIVNVGDSRTYLFRSGFGLKQVTRDHSVVATLVAFGEITPDQVYTHPERNKVYRSLGHTEHIDVDWFMLDLSSQDALLLCSDGLWEMVRNPDIAYILQHYSDAVASSDALVKAALRGGGKDNISVIVARVP